MSATPTVYVYNDSQTVWLAIGIYTPGNAGIVILPPQTSGKVAVALDSNKANNRFVVSYDFNNVNFNGDTGIEVLQSQFDTAADGTPGPTTLSQNRTGYKGKVPVTVSCSVTTGDLPVIVRANVVIWTTGPQTSPPPSNKTDPPQQGSGNSLVWNSTPVNRRNRVTATSDRVSFFLIRSDCTRAAYVIADADMSIAVPYEYNVMFATHTCLDPSWLGTVGACNVSGTCSTKTECYIADTAVVFAGTTAYSRFPQPPSITGTGSYSSQWQARILWTPQACDSETPGVPIRYAIKTLPAQTSLVALCTPDDPVHTFSTGTQSFSVPANSLTPQLGVVFSMPGIPYETPVPLVPDAVRMPDGSIRHLPIQNVGLSKWLTTAARYVYTSTIDGAVHSSTFVVKYFVEATILTGSSYVVTDPTDRSKIPQPETLVKVCNATAAPIIVTGNTSGFSRCDPGSSAVVPTSGTYALGGEVVVGTVTSATVSQPVFVADATSGVFVTNAEAVTTTPYAALSYPATPQGFPGGTITEAIIVAPVSRLVIAVNSTYRTVAVSFAAADATPTSVAADAPPINLTGNPPTTVYIPPLSSRPLFPATRYTVTFLDQTPAVVSSSASSSTTIPKGPEGTQDVVVTFDDATKTLAAQESLPFINDLVAAEGDTAPPRVVVNNVELNPPGSATLKAVPVTPTYDITVTAAATPANPSPTPTTVRSNADVAVTSFPEQRIQVSLVPPGTRAPVTPNNRLAPGVTPAAVRVGRWVAVALVMPQPFADCEATVVQTAGGAADNDDEALSALALVKGKPPRRRQLTAPTPGPDNGGGDGGGVLMTSCPRIEDVTTFGGALVWVFVNTGNFPVYYATLSFAVVPFVGGVIVNSDPAPETNSGRLDPGCSVLVQHGQASGAATNPRCAYILSTEPVSLNVATGKAVEVTVNFARATASPAFIVNGAVSTLGANNKLHFNPAQSWELNAGSVGPMQATTGPDEAEQFMLTTESVQFTGRCIHTIGTTSCFQAMIAARVTANAPGRPYVPWGAGPLLLVTDPADTFVMTTEPATKKSAFNEATFAIPYSKLRAADTGASLPDGLAMANVAQPQRAKYVSTYAVENALQDSTTVTLTASEADFTDAQYTRYVCAVPGFTDCNNGAATCIGYFSAEYGNKCANDCTLFARGDKSPASDPLLASACASLTTDYCDQNGPNKSSLECSCANASAENNTFTVTGFDGNQYTFAQYQDFLSEVFGVNVLFKQPRCWWPSCLPGAQGVLPVIDLDCPQKIWVCLAAIQNVEVENSSVDIKVACEGNCDDPAGCKDPTKPTPDPGPGPNPGPGPPRPPNPGPDPCPGPLCPTPDPCPGPLCPTPDPCPGPLCPTPDPCPGPLCPSPAPRPKKTQSGVSTPVIAGSVVGAVVFIALIAFLVYWFMLRKSPAKTSRPAASVKTK